MNITMGEEGSGDDVDMPDYPECPCCVMDEYDRSAERCKPYAHRVPFFFVLSMLVGRGGFGRFP